MYGTPFEDPIFGDYFVVKQKGRTVPYRGPLAKRDLSGGPMETLAGGERKSVDVDIRRLYAIGAPGHYTVRFRPHRFDGAQWLGARVKLDDAGERISLQIP